MHFVHGKIMFMVFIQDSRVTIPLQYLDQGYLQYYGNPIMETHLFFYSNLKFNNSIFSGKNFNDKYHINNI